MGKIQFCRICRTKANLKFTAKTLREFNKKRLLSSQETQADKASQKLLRSTPTLGNICKDCDDRVQIFHRLDEGTQSSDSDVEIDVDSAIISLPPVAQPPPACCRPDTPIIVDDDDMLYDLFIQKVDQQRLQRQQIEPIQIQPQTESQPSQTFIGHFNSQYTPPQSTGGSEGDDAKIIEVLTSRESTPASSICTIATPVPAAPRPPDIVDNQGHRIVAIIDLDDGDEDDAADNQNCQQVINPSCIEENQKPVLNCSQNVVVVASAKFQTETTKDNQLLLTPVTSTDASTTAFSEDDEEIVFRRVETKQESTPSKRRKRKSYDDKQLRLVASLSLVSSDSESEEPVKKSKTVAPNFFSCKECHLNLPDKESLSLHERVHEGFKCPECHFGFPQEKRLVHHMRYKHRSYNGDVLAEKPRAAHDSAMTIRLRYMQNTTFYECQLCGRIDDVFKDHKDHVISKHPVESKTLRDPIMKQLKCPVCKVKCGVQYLSLCRHFLIKHEYAQYKSHLREILHVSAFGWNGARQQEVAKTARIFQFLKRKSFFFECKVCHKVVSGYLNHLKHLKSHTKLELEKNAENKMVTKPPSTSNSKNKTKNEILGKLLRSKTKTKQMPQKDSKSFKAPTTKSVKNTKTLYKKSPAVAVKLRQPIIKAKVSPQPINKAKAKKPKIPEIVKAVEKVNKRKRKENSMPKSQGKRIKIKASIKQINLQTYNCIYCSKQIKGFILYNTHLRQEHIKSEYRQCIKCAKSFVDAERLTTHMEQRCSKAENLTNKRKRNAVSSQSKNTDVAKCKRKCAVDIRECDQQEVPGNSKDEGSIAALEGEKEHESMWLKELLNLNISKNNSDNSSTNLTNTAVVALCQAQPNKHGAETVQQCCYCLHLFPSRVELKDHSRQQHSRKSDVLIRYTPFKA